MKTKIIALHIIHKFGMGGAETWIMEIIRALKKGKREIQIELLVTSGEPSFFDDEAKKLGVKIHYIKFNKSNVFGFVRSFRELLKKSDFFVLHDHQEFLSGWHFLFGIGYLPEVRICHVHNPSYQLKSNYGVSFERKLKIRIGMFLVKMLATDVRGTSNQVLSLSGYSEKKFSKQNPKSLHCFFDVNKYQNYKNEERLKLFHKFDIPSENKLILFIGRLDYSLDVKHEQNHKNSVFALNVLAELKGKNFTMLFVGKNNYIATEFINLSKFLGVEKQIRLLGVRQDIPQLLGASDLLFFPSREEGLGMVAVEAQMSGTRVLASSAVPKECVVIDELVSFLDLSLNYNIWSDKIVELTTKYDKLEFQKDKRIESSPFNINVGLLDLIKLYKKRKLKILIFENHGNRCHGGAEKSMAMFGDFLKSKGVEILLVCDYHKEYFKDNKCAPIELMSTNPLIKYKPWIYIKSLVSFYKVLKKHKPDLIFTHTIHAFPLLRIVSHLTRTPIAVQFKWIYGGCNIGIFNRWGLRGIQTYIALNPFIGDFWEKQIGKKNVKMNYVPDGVIFSDFERNQIPNSKPKKLLFFGRITINKGLHLLLESFQFLNEKCILTILGNFDPLNDKYHRELEKLVKEKNLTNVIFKGFQINVESYIQESDLVIVPSITPEAQPFAVLESISIKTPVISSDIGGVPFIYNDEFWMFKPNCPISLSSKINEILNFDPEELKNKMEYLFHQTEQNFNIKKTQKELLRKIANNF
jgi:glycosyltransferase involved in cell wall biosynthesis